MSEAVDLLIHGSTLVDMIRGLTELGVSFKYAAATGDDPALVTIKLHDGEGEDLEEVDDSLVMAQIKVMAVGVFECCRGGGSSRLVHGEEALAAWINQFFADHRPTS